jgi:phosphohistidine phosphatase SixA
MGVSARVAVAFGVIAALSTAIVGRQAPVGAGETLVPLLRAGGYVLVMRHASSPQQAPAKEAANSDNTKLERQLDATGRAGSAAMGRALRELKIPVGEVLSSPMYRALETVRAAGLPTPHVHAELGEGPSDMQGVSEAQAAWLRDRATRLPKGTNTIVVTHAPNLQRAFPAWGAVAQGEVVVVGPDSKGAAVAIGRIKMEEWPRPR